MEKETSNTKKQSKGFLKYTSMAFQMIAIILMGVFIGKYIDNKFNGKGLYLALISLFFVFGGIYISIKDLIKPK